MRCFLKVLTLICLSVSFISAQQPVRQQSLDQKDKPENQIKKSGLYLAPEKSDLAEAQKQGLEVFRILPRGMFDYEENELGVRGGGAYYSFAKKSHSYNATPQIELQQGKFLVGFAGADYGFIADLGKVPLADVTRESESLKFLLSYQAAREESFARSEFRKIRDGFQVDNLTYQRKLPAIVGHTYILRAISFDEADTLVALTVHRKDANGSLIVFWKLIENFEKPQIARN